MKSLMNFKKESDLLEVRRESSDLMNKSRD